MSLKFKSIVLMTAALGLSGCATYNVNQGLDRVNRDANGFTQNELNFAKNKEERDKRLAATNQLLAKPVGQKEAVQLLLANSPAFQALLAQNWVEAASAAQSGRISNPTFAFESVVTGSEAELNRFFSFGLLDLITLPQRLISAPIQSRNWLGVVATISNSMSSKRLVISGERTIFTISRL